MIVNNCLVLVSCIPYLLYIYLLIKEEILNPDRKLREILRFDNLILIGIFVVFTKYKVSIVNEMLFFTMNLYFYVNKLYDKNIKRTIKVKEYLLTIIFIYILSIATFIPYIFFNKLIMSYYIAFGFVFFLHYFYLIIKNTTKK